MEDIAVGPPTKGSAPTRFVMISSFVIAAILCVVAESDESKLVKVITDRKRYEPRVEYNEEAEGAYPLIVQQPYPIYVQKRIPYQDEQYEGQYDRKLNQGVYTSKKEEFEYGPDIVRSPVIFAVSSQPGVRRPPYPLRIQKETRTPSCVEDLNYLNEELEYPRKDPATKKDTSGEGGKQENIKVTLIETDAKSEQPISLSERDVPISSDYGKKEGSVQHKEAFQTPILIAIEKPGYRYVKHLVGAGVLPEARQFHVLILEEDVPIDKTNTEGSNSAKSERNDVSKDPSSKDKRHNNQEEKIELDEEKEKNLERNTDDSKAIEGKITFPSEKDELKEDKNESLGEDETKKTSPDGERDETNSKAAIDIKIKQF